MGTKIAVAFANIFMDKIEKEIFRQSSMNQNVAKKQTSHSLKLFRDYPNSPCYLKEGNLV